MKSPLFMAVKPKEKGALPMDEESAEAAPDSKGGESAEYKSLIAESAKAGDWDAFADAVSAYVDHCSMKGS